MYNDRYDRDISDNEADVIRHDEASEWYLKARDPAVAAAKAALINAIASARYVAPFHPSLLDLIDGAISEDIEHVLHDILGNVNFSDLLRDIEL